MAKKKTLRWVGNPTFTAYLVRTISLYSILQFNNANIIRKDFSERNKMIPFYVVTVFWVCYNRKNMTVI